ncbi:RepB family plasmid replication initiator protein, partial [Acinetobacter ursingii]
NDTQSLLFSTTLVHAPSFASPYSKVGESYDDVAIRISENLTIPDKVQEYLPYLDKVGFNTA